MNGSIGPSKNFKECLPQAPSFPPSLFTIYIGDFLAEVRDNTFVSAYADDLAISRNAHNEDTIIASLRPKVDKVVALSAKVRLNLDTYKCETDIFSLDCAEASWQPNIIIDGKRMFCNPFPVLLGVRHDRQLTFGRHIRKIC